CGMDRDEIALAIERHATSKLATDRLDDIRTLGFRGEALPSIAAVSRFALASRQPGADTAHEIRIEAGRAGPIRPVAFVTGTRVEVRDLFFATPARLKFLKSERAESAAAVEAVRRRALAHPEITFVVPPGVRTPLTYP